MSGSSTLDPDNFPSAPDRVLGRGHGTGALGPSDTSDSGALQARSRMAWRIQRASSVPPPSSTDDKVRVNSASSKPFASSIPKSCDQPALT